jgi:hypothetical protein
MLPAMNTRKFCFGFGHRIHTHFFLITEYSVYGILCISRFGYVFMAIRFSHQGITLRTESLKANLFSLVLEDNNTFAQYSLLQIWSRIFV